MARRRNDGYDGVYGEEEYHAVEDEGYSEDDGGGTKRKRGRRSNISDHYAEEDGDDGEEYGGGRKRRGKGPANFFDLEAQVDSDDDEEEEDEEGDDGFIDTGADIPDEDDRRVHRRPILTREDEQYEDVEEIEKRIHERYAGRSLNVEYDEEATDVEQQALLPSIRDPKLWMVKCAIGHERELAGCIMQKCIDKGPHIRSIISLDHLKVGDVCENLWLIMLQAVKGMRNIYPSKIMLVPIREMTDVLSVESKAVDISRDTWVRMKIGIYKGDLATVVDVDNVRQRATVKLIPRIDLQALANKLEGSQVPKKKAFIPSARFMNIDEARGLHIRVEHKCDPSTGDYYEMIEGMMFKDGFLYKNVSLKSLRVQNVEPTYDELEKFRQPSLSRGGDMSSSTMLFANRKKGHFMKGDQVIIIKGDLKNLKGRVEKVEEDIVHIKPNEKLLPKTLAFSHKELCKYFKPGNHVKVVSGSNTGATGMVDSVEGHLVSIVSDTSKEHLRVFADNVVESSEVTSSVARIGDYELHNHLRSPPCVTQSTMRPPRGGSMNFGGRHKCGRGGRNALVGSTVKICSGCYKGFKGRVIDVKGSTVRVELESQMKVVAVDRKSISNNVDLSTPFRETTRYGSGSETPMHIFCP